MRSLYSSIVGDSLGVGLGLRAPHVAHVLEQQPNVDWFELLADNHMVAGGWARRQANLIAERYPVTLHCLGMSIGSSGPIDYGYLAKVKAMANEVRPKIISDHLCWTSYQDQQSHDLLPLPMTEEAVTHCAERIKRIQDYLKQPIALENITSYMTFKHSTLTEVDFINAIANQADCHILLDLNNIYVNHKNNGLDAADYLNRIDSRRVVEIHLAGFQDLPSHLLDSHNNNVDDAVWRLYQVYLKKHYHIPTLIEWDHDIPEFDTLYNEAQKATAIRQNMGMALGEPRGTPCVLPL